VIELSQLCNSTADRPEVCIDTLVIACGNPMRGDDGVGPMVASRVEAQLTKHKSHRHRFVIVHQLLPELAPELAQAGQAILIDARLAGDEAVGVVRVEIVEPEMWHGHTGPSKQNTHADLTHHWTFPRLLAIADALYGRSPRAYAVSVSAKDFDHGEALSPAIADAVHTMCEEVRRLMTS
jgi:hydrogenase maturation protease